MPFDETFAADLGERLGTTVDTAEFADSDSVSTLLSDLATFLNDLDQLSRDSLDAVVADGIDISAATDDVGDSLDLPGGAFLALAAGSGQSLSSLVEHAQESLQVALNDSGNGTEGENVNV